MELKKDILDEVRDKIAHENIPEIAKLGDMEKMTNIMNIMSQLKEKSELIDDILEKDLDVEEYKIPVKNYGIYLRADYTELNNQK